MKRFRHFLQAILAFNILFFVAMAGPSFAQSTSGSIAGTVKDSTGASIPGAVVTLANPVSGYTRTATAGADGSFHFYNLPFNPYRVSVKVTNFAISNQLVDVSSTLPINLNVVLQPATATQTVDVEASPDLVEKDPHAHVDIDRTTIDRLPLDEPSSALSSIVTELSPGVAADSNGLLHGLGDHNEVSFSIDGQPITDQQSKVFSNQVPAAAIQSLEVIEGAPPAEYGDKTSLVIVGTTRSGQGVMTPAGSVTLSYGTFGSSNLAVDAAYGGANWGNFIAANGMQSGRFLDAPEFAVYHDKGNEENVFDRIDFQLSNVSSIHVNGQYTRSWFQTPNSYDSQFNFSQTPTAAGPSDQRSKIQTLDIAPTYTRIIGSNGILNFAPYIRRDGYNYYPSNNLLDDLGQGVQGQQESLRQQRTLTNAGVHSDFSYLKGINNIKVGGQYSQTFVRENDQLGIVDQNLNAGCLNATGAPDPGTNINACPPGDTPNPYFYTLLPYDLTSAGHPYTYYGQTDVKQLALYGEDQITAGRWLFNLGIRGDIYNGIAIQKVAEPRIAISYNIPKTSTVLRVSYARTQETPFNENLVLSSQGCLNPVVAGIFTETYGYCTPASFNPGFRNEFHAGFQQAIGHYFVLSGEYITKYTHNAYDFSILGNTPLTFPIEWHNSKIPGYTLSGTLTEVKGLTARVTMSSVAARFFNPQIGGVGATVGAQGGFPFRIDHDERFNQTTHIEYKMPFRKSLYYSFNWKFDSGLVAGSAPCYNVTDPNSPCGGILIGGQPGIDLSAFTADQQFQGGFVCNNVHATQTSGFNQCLASQFHSTLISIPAPGTEDDDRNPQRIAQRNLFDMALGDDHIVNFGADHYHFGARLTAINITNKDALYNYLSTFSGTHYVSPRSVTAELAFHF